MVCVLTLFISNYAHAQSTFQNLDFEQARNIPVFDPQGHPWVMPATDALPDWTCYVGTNQLGIVAYNDLALDSAFVSLLPSYSPYVPVGFTRGQYSVELQSGYLGGGTSPTFGPASIAQTGQIALTDRSIFFRGPLDVSGISVSFAGSSIPLILWAQQDVYNTYAGDVSGFAGQSGELRFTSAHHLGAYIDDIRFSSTPVPEPNSLFVLGLGVIVLAWHRQQRHVTAIRGYSEPAVALGPRPIRAP